MTSGICVFIGRRPAHVCACVCGSTRACACARALRTNGWPEGARVFRQALGYMYVCLPLTISQLPPYIFISVSVSHRYGKMCNCKNLVEL